MLDTHLLRSNTIGLLQGMRSSRRLRRPSQLVVWCRGNSHVGFSNVVQVVSTEAVLTRRRSAVAVVADRGHRMAGRTAAARSPGAADRPAEVAEGSIRPGLGELLQMVITVSP